MKVEVHKNANETMTPDSVEESLSDRNKWLTKLFVIGMTIIITLGFCFLYYLSTLDG